MRESETELNDRRRLRGTRRVLGVLIALFVAGIVIAAVTLMLSNTARDTATIGVFDEDWTASVAIPTDVQIEINATVDSGYLRESPARNYGAEGFTSVSFILLWSNLTTSDFSDVTVTFQPSGDAYTEADLITITHPLTGAISGVGLRKTYTSGDFGSLPPAGSSATFSGSFRLSQQNDAGTLEAFSWVEGVKS